MFPVRRFCHGVRWKGQRPSPRVAAEKQQTGATQPWTSQEVGLKNTDPLPARGQESSTLTCSPLAPSESLSDRGDCDTRANIAAVPRKEPGGSPHVSVTTPRPGGVRRTHVFPGTLFSVSSCQTHQSFCQGAWGTHNDSARPSKP